MKASDLDRQFAALLPGESLVYYIGWIASDREENAKVDDLAARAAALSRLTLCRRPVAFLTQRRLDSGAYEYRITKARHATQAEASPVPTRIQEPAHVAS